MEEMSLTSCHNRHKTKSLTNRKKARGDGYPNILREQEFPIAARMGLTSDITYLRTAEGFMYHCVIRDIVTGDVLGDYMADRMTKELVLNAITAMLARTELAKGCIFHSDRGSQYTSKAVMGLLQRHGLRQSFSRVGMPGDNAWSESFFAHLKKKPAHWTHLRTRDEARQKNFANVEGFYNASRVQKRLDYLNPIEWLSR